VASKSRQFLTRADGADGIPVQAKGICIKSTLLLGGGGGGEVYTSVCAVEIRVTVNNNGLV
jgi:hypothetical protein